LFKTLSDSWMLQLRAEGKSPATLINYGGSVWLFAAWLDALPEDGFPPRVTDWADVTRDHCRAWLAHLVDFGASQDTRRGRHCGVDRFFAWLVLEEEVERNPLDGMPLPSPGQMQVQALTVDQMRKLIKQFGRSEFRDVRDEAIVRPFLDSGLRLSELADLTLDNLDITNGTCAVMGKGAKPRVVPRRCPCMDRPARADEEGRHLQDAARARGRRRPWQSAPAPVAALVRARLARGRRQRRRPDEAGRLDLAVHVAPLRRLARRRTRKKGAPRLALGDRLCVMTFCRHDVMTVTLSRMARRKTTVYLDDDLLTATKVVAASSARSESDVVADALRAYLKGDVAKAAAAEVRAVMQRVTKRGPADEATAMKVALDEVAKTRKARQARK
jgi:Phage integrase family/Phage integrase, N-terminal SAM-like domain